ncbi:hypothetical protein FACS189441_5500 [Betaproteobacteria bacterium]|nr:hypothetical protein FACS189441_5500 [Betaproteobacteria bacterium]
MDFTTDSGEGQLRVIQAFLAEHQGTGDLDAEELIAQLKRLRETGLPPLACQNTLEMLFTCSSLYLKAQVGNFVGSRIPLDRGQRQQVHNLQKLLDKLAAAYEWLLENLPEDTALETLFPFLERVAFCLNQHLYISYLVAAPAQQGIWQRLHRTHQRSLRAPLESAGHHRKLTAYREALLLAAGQPTSHASRELEFAADYIVLLTERIAFTAEAPADSSAIFWIEPTRDFSLFALSRRAPPPEYHVFYFSCAHIAALVQQHLDALNAGSRARDLHLPPLADTPTGQGVLRRLIAAWGTPGKRRFPRRRQANHQRAVLCAGLNRFCQLLQQNGARDDSKDFSQWMMINESPDGYALMHLTGATGHIRIGDVVALRPDSDPGWLVCLVRWAISENPEHIEIGLQIIALDAIPGTLGDNVSQVSVLLLPENTPMRTVPALLAPSGSITGKQCTLRLDGSNKVRECKELTVIEQNGRIELFTFEV